MKQISDELAARSSRTTTFEGSWPSRSEGNVQVHEIVMLPVLFVTLCADSETLNTGVHSFGASWNNMTGEIEGRGGTGNTWDARNGSNAISSSPQKLCEALTVCPSLIKPAWLLMKQLCWIEYCCLEIDSAANRSPGVVDHPSWTILDSIRSSIPVPVPDMRIALELVPTEVIFRNTFCSTVLFEARFNTAGVVEVSTWL